MSAPTLQDVSAFLRQTSFTSSSSQSPHISSQDPEEHPLALINRSQPASRVLARSQSNQSQASTLPASSHSEASIPSSRSELTSPPSSGPSEVTFSDSVMDCPVKFTLDSDDGGIGSNSVSSSDTSVLTDVTTGPVNTTSQPRRGSYAEIASMPSTSPRYSPMRESSVSPNAGRGTQAEGNRYRDGYNRRGQQHQRGRSGNRSRPKNRHSSDPPRDRNERYYDDQHSRNYDYNTHRDRPRYHQGQSQYGDERGRNYQRPPQYRGGRGTSHNEHHRSSSDSGDRSNKQYGEGRGRGWGEGGGRSRRGPRQRSQSSTQYTRQNSSSFSSSMDSYDPVAEATGYTSPRTRGAYSGEEGGQRGGGRGQHKNYPLGDNDGREYISEGHGQHNNSSGGDDNRNKGSFSSEQQRHSRGNRGGYRGSRPGGRGHRYPGNDQGQFFQR